MMKRKFILLSVFTVFALTSCEFKLDKYVFKKKAAEILRDIEQHTKSVSELKTCTVSLIEHTDAKGTSEGKNIQFNYDSEMSALYSTDDVFCYYKSYSRESLTEGSETNSTATTAEFWAFVKDEKLCVATRQYQLNNGTATETKEYTYKTDYLEYFKTQVSVINFFINLFCNDKTYASQIADSYEGHPSSGIEYKSIWNLSSGDGCFKTRGKATLEDYSYNGTPSTGKAKIHLVWTDYLLTKLKIDADVKAKMAINDKQLEMDTKQVSEGELKLKAKKFSLDLSGFTYKESN